jgi:hypothetical protein
VKKDREISKKKKVRTAKKSKSTVSPVKHRLIDTLGMAFNEFTVDIIVL